MKVDFIEKNKFDLYINNTIVDVLKEDIGDGDHTSLACFSDDDTISTKLVSKDEGIIAGLDLAGFIFKHYDKSLEIEYLKKDGDRVQNGDLCMTVKGKAMSILTCERVMLNFLQNLSGIATETNKIVQLISNYNVKLLDTRKTTPGLRLLEKWAVRIGGGYNHRIGLFDMIMIKDNHIDQKGNVKNAIKSVQNYLNINNLHLDIIVEARNMEQINDIMEIGGIRRILIDNFFSEDLQKAVKFINNKFETEASGGINRQNIIEYAQTGVDFISSGAITQSARALDFSLKTIC